MDRRSIRLMSVAMAVSLGLFLSSAGAGAAGQGDEPLPPEPLQVNYESGQGYGDLAECRPGEIIVQFDPNVLPTERHQIVQDHGCLIARTSDLGDFHLIRIPATTTRASLPIGSSRARPWRAHTSRDWRLCWPRTV